MPPLKAIILSLALVLPVRTEAQMTPEEFQITFPATQVADLRARLAATRWPDVIDGSGTAYGIDQPELQALMDYWRTEFDFDAAAARLNSFPNARVDIDGRALHFIHLPSEVEGAIPLLLLHGWPSSFVQMLDIALLLTEPGEDGPAFHVVIASLPGYGYSEAATAPGLSPAAIAPAMNTLMVEVLGYDRYGVRSSDLGAGVAARMAADYPDHIIGSHTGGTNPFLQGATPTDLTPEEAAFVTAAGQWMQTEMAYAFQHSSKPQTVAIGLNDSPAGLAAWIMEKFWRWTDHDGDLYAVIDRDTLLTNLTIYWLTETINSSVRLYAEAARDPSGWAMPQVPVGYLMPVNDLFETPRSWIERQGPVGHWTPSEVGGHFMELEQPEIVADDLRLFFGGLER